MAETDIPKTTIATLFSLFEALLIPFDLRNAVQTFQGFINKAIPSLDFVFDYIDDILVASKTEEDKRKHLEIVFKRPNFHEIIINFFKSKIRLNTRSFLIVIYLPKVFSDEKIKEIR